MPDAQSGRVAAHGFHDTARAVQPIPDIMAAQHQTEDVRHRAIIHATENRGAGVVAPHVRLFGIFLRARDAVGIDADGPRIRDIHDWAERMGRVISRGNPIAPVVQSGRQLVHEF